MFNFHDIINLNEYIDNEINKLLGINVTTKKNILVLSGGGIKGISHIGVLKALNEYDILKNIKTISATSIGALIAYLYIIGYNSNELENVLMNINFLKLTSFQTNILNDFGFDNGDKIVYVLIQLTKNKSITPLITFKELYEKTHIKFIITTCCLNTKRVHYLSYKTEPTMSVLTGVRMSFSFPIYFTPIVYKNNIFIDGGCIDNYPIHIFKEQLDNVIGVYLNEQIEIKKHINTFEDFLIHLILSLLEGVNINSTKEYENQTIKINIAMANCLNFNISTKQKRKLIFYGYNETLKFIKKNKLL